MKKKSLIVLMAVVIIVFGLVGPAGAKQPFNVRAVFESDIVPADTQTLEKGEVYIRESGNFKVEIEGAAEDTTYGAYLLYGTPGDPTEIHLGDFDTDEEGEGKLEGDGLCLDGFAGNPWIEIRIEDEVQFVSGFALPCS